MRRKLLVLGFVALMLGACGGSHTIGGTVTMQDGTTFKCSELYHDWGTSYTVCAIERKGSEARLQLYESDIQRVEYNHG